MKSSCYFSLLLAYNICLYSVFMAMMALFFSLLAFLGGCEKREGRVTWSNWGGNQRATPRKIWYPKSRGELQEIVEGARGMEVHAYGAGHSWSDLVPTEGYLVNTKGLDRVLEIDHEKRQVRVEAGMTLEKLNGVLEREGLALKNLGRVTVQSVAGVTATGTHGTGHTPTLSSFITGIELLTADGTFRTIAENSELLPAARLSLGGLGLIYSVTLQCEESFVLESRCTQGAFEEVVANYRKLLTDNDYWMLEWNPYTGKALSYAWNRTPLPPTNNAWRKVCEALQEATLNVLTLLLEPFPTFTPSLTDMRFSFLAHRPYRAESYKVLTRPYLGMRYVECEMSIDPQFLPAAIPVLKELFAQFASEHIYVPRVTFRFVSQDSTTLLSPAYDGNRVYISLVMPSHSPFATLFKQYQQKMEPLHARPHWGKIHYMDATLAHKLYGDRLDRFLAIRNQLDPQGMFLNKQLKALMH